MEQNNQQQVDLVALQQQIVGLQNQRNAAFNDAADLFGKLQSANTTINQLVTALQAAQAQMGGSAAKPDVPVDDVVEAPPANEEVDGGATSDEVA